MVAMQIHINVMTNTSQAWSITNPTNGRAENMQCATSIKVTTMEINTPLTIASTHDPDFNNGLQKKIQKIIFILYLITLFKILNHWTHFFGIYMYVLIMFNDDGLEFFCPANQNIYKYILYIHMYNFLTVNLIIIMVKLNFQGNYEEFSG